MERDIEKLIELLALGNGTDGSHHKNWYFAQCLFIVLGEDGYNDFIDQNPWFDAGIIP